MSDHVVAGTGFRSLRVADRPVQVAAQRCLNTRVDQLQADHGDRLVLMSGLAEGWDELIAVTAIARSIRLWAAIPNRGYGRWYWGQKSATKTNRLARFDEIVAQAWQVTYVMEDVHHTSGLHLNGRHANFLRNDWMVRGKYSFTGANDFLVLGPVKPKTGTADCVETIKRAGKWRDSMVLSPQPATLPL